MIKTDDPFAGESIEFRTQKGPSCLPKTLTVSAVDIEGGECTYRGVIPAGNGGATWDGDCPSGLKVAPGTYTATVENGYSTGDSESFTVAGLTACLQGQHYFVGNTCKACPSGSTTHPSNPNICNCPAGKEWDVQSETCKTAPGPGPTVPPPSPTAPPPGHPKVKLLDNPCSKNGITLAGVYDYDQGTPGTERAVTMFFIANSHQNTKTNKRPYLIGEEYLKSINITSSIGGNQDLLSASVILPTYENVRDDAAVVSIYGHTIGGGPDYISALLFGEQYNALRGFLQPEKGGLRIRANQLIFILSPNLNKVAHSDQVLSVSFPNNQTGKRETFNLQFTKGNNSTWSQALCL